MGLGDLIVEFQSTLPARGATKQTSSAISRRKISIHAPRTGSDFVRREDACSTSDFNPRSPHGERPSRQQSTPAASNFNPRSPHGERRHPTHRRPEYRPFQSTLPARGATRAASQSQQPPAISIHAPRTGSDNAEANQKFRAISISIHAPRTGSDGWPPPRTAGTPLFQSTLPARGATMPSPFWLLFLPISIHAPRTGSDASTGSRRSGKSSISIHAPRTGSDAMRGLLTIVEGISIHAPRTGSDEPGRNRRHAGRYFNPRSPHGERLLLELHTNMTPCYFNPRSPHGERLQELGRVRAALVISIHAPRTGSDITARALALALSISIHAPRTGSDPPHPLLPHPQKTFQSTLPARGATPPHRGRHRPRLISIHAPRTGSDCV